MPPPIPPTARQTSRFATAARCTCGRPARTIARRCSHFLRELSHESRRLRFFSPGTNLSSAATWASDVDYEQRYGLVATAARHAPHRGARRLRAHRRRPRRGRVRGSGRISRAAGSARSCSPTSPRPQRSTASRCSRRPVLPDNYRMAEVFRESGFAPRIRSKPDQVAVEFPTTISAEALERFEERDRIAAVAAVRHFLEPRLGGGDRRLADARARSAARSSTTCSSAGFNGPRLPGQPDARRRAVGARLQLGRGRPGRGRARGSWRCRRRRSSTSRASAPQRACGRWS